MNRIVRRLGSTPEERGSATGQSCPDVFELDDGDFVIVGERGIKPWVLDEIKSLGGSVEMLTETAIIIPRRVLIDAKKDIPDE